jgi:hypothetical protein
VNVACGVHWVLRTYRLQTGCLLQQTNWSKAMETIFDVISNLDNAAKIPALRAITHSAMAKCIGAIRQHLRNEEHTERDEESQVTALDQRNEQDENTRSVEEIAREMGFNENMPAIKQASIWHAVYSWADAELRTITTSKWDEPLSLDGMLKFMTEKAQPLDKTLVKALAQAAHTDEKTIVKLHELQDMRDRERLKEMIPAIIQTFNGFGDNGYEDSVTDLPVVAQHQLGVKVVEALMKARDQVLVRVMRSRRLTDLASIPLIEEGIVAMTKWVDEFEKRHRDEIGEAIEQGVNVRTLEDLRT